MLKEMDQSKFKLRFLDPSHQVEHDGLMVLYVDDSGTMANNFPVGKGLEAITTVAQSGNACSSQWEGHWLLESVFSML